MVLLVEEKQEEVLSFFFLMGRKTEWNVLDLSKEEERTESRGFGDGGRIREGGVLYVALVKEEEMRERCAFRYAEEEMMECRGTGEE